MCETEAVKKEIEEKVTKELSGLFLFSERTDILAERLTVLIFCYFFIKKKVENEL